ncbi:MAG: hypothetical protein DMF73_10630 [Acidobacteria bacterium]|nr:MAG: hypothetical protein DMF73_10630 [Acidobacteriota bacterium]
MDTASRSSPILGVVMRNKASVLAFMSQAVYRNATISLPNSANGTIKSTACSDYGTFQQPIL